MAISFFQRISRAVMGKSRVDDRTLDAVEEALVESDMGVDTTLKIIDNLEDRVARDKFMSFDELVGLLRDEISSLIDDGGPGLRFLEETIRHTCGRSERSRQDHHDRQARLPSEPSGKEGHPRSRRHLQGSRGRPARYLGGARRSRHSQAGHGFRIPRRSPTTP